MRTFIVLFAVLAVSLAETYKTTFDNLDVEAIVTNPETLQAYTSCFVDAGPCDEISSRFKVVLAEAMQTACSKCTQPQKHMLKRYLQEVKKNPDQVAVLKNKYDPEDKFLAPLRAALKDA